MNGENDNGNDRPATQAPSLQYSRADLSPAKTTSVLPWIIFGVVLLLMLSGIGLFWWLGKHSVQATPAGGRGGKGGAAGDIPIVAATVRKGDMIVYLDGLGMIQATNSATIRSRVDGVLLEVDFKEGNVVNEGDVLALIDPAPYKAVWDVANGQLKKDQATLEGAENDLKIYQSISGPAMSKQQLADQEAMVKQLQGTVEADAAQVESAKVNLDYCTIRAPFTGKIGIRLIDKGNIVHAGDATGIALIAQLQPISMVFSLPQDDLPQVMKAYNSGRKITVFAMDRTLLTEFGKGELVAIDNVIDPMTGTFKIKSTFPNLDSSLVPNQFVNARIDVATLKGAVIAPTAAVQSGMDSSYVYVVKVDDSADKKGGIKGTVQMRKVTVGHTEGDETTIDDGLAENEIVVIDGLDKLNDDTKVTVRMQEPEPPTTQPSSATRPSRGGRGAGGGGKPSSATRPSSPVQKP